MCLNLNRKHLCSNRSKYLMRFWKPQLQLFIEKERYLWDLKKDCLLYKERDFIFLMYNLIRILPFQPWNLQFEKKNKKVMSEKYFRRVAPIYFLGKCPKYTEGRNLTQAVLVYWIFCSLKTIAQLSRDTYKDVLHHKVHQRY